MSPELNVSMGHKLSLVLLSLQRMRESECERVWANLQMMTLDLRN